MKKLSGWNQELALKLKGLLEDPKRPKNTYTYHMVLGFSRGMSCTPNPIAPIYWSDYIFVNEPPNFSNEQEVAEFYRALIALSNEHIEESFAGECKLPFEVAYDSDKNKRQAIEEWATGFILAYEVNRQEWEELCSLYDDYEELDMPESYDIPSQQIGAILYCMRVIADSVQAVESGTRERDLEDIFDTFKDNVIQLGIIGQALYRVDSQYNDDYDLEDQIEINPIEEHFDYDQFEQLFRQKRLINQAMPAPKILGFLLSVAVAPQLLKPSEWLPMLAHNPDDPIRFDSNKQSEIFIEHCLKWMNYCSKTFLHQQLIQLPCSFYDDPKTPTKALQTFFDGYLYGYSWLEMMWDKFLQNDSEEDRLIGTCALIAMQIYLWPKDLKEDSEGELPNFIEECNGDFNRLSDIWCEFVSDLGALSLNNAVEVMAEQPAHNPYKHVGRNDPCPCGSGKKFKKCCLH